MATECTEFWKIKGNILNKTHHESPTEKEDLPSPGVIRKLSRKSIRVYEDPNDPLRAQINKALEAESKKRNSYMLADRIIVEESENSNSSSSVKSRSQTSETSSDDNSSYNIFGAENSIDQTSRKFLTPNIAVKRLSSMNLSKVDQSSSKLNDSSVSSLNSSSSNKSSGHKTISKHESNSSNSKSKFATSKYDPEIMAKIDPRLINPTLQASMGQTQKKSGLNLGQRRSTAINPP